jgi:putative transposase
VVCYQSKRAAADAPALKLMRELSAQYPRYGYRRIRIFLRRCGCPMSADRAYRLWRLSSCAARPTPVCMNGQCTGKPAP